jgi:ribosomal protein S18 acetylase RimI-like enzyme
MTVTDPTTTRIEPDRVIPTLVLAFSADPVARWLFPETGRYHAAFGELVGLAAGDALAAGSIDVAHDGAGVAVWVPPGVEPDADGYVDLFGRHIDPARQGDVFTWGAELGVHHPPEPHWYLAYLGVDPHWQGQGFGSTLLRKGLARCDRDGLPAYLEIGNPRNRGLYERHGFEVTAEVQVADAPPVWPMLRPARP